MHFHKWAEACPTRDGWQATCPCGGVMPLERDQWSTGCPQCGLLYTVDWQSSGSNALAWALNIAAQCR